MKKSVVVFCCAAIINSMNVAAQVNKTDRPNKPSPFTIGLIDKIESVELSETRVLNIYLPDGYSPDSSISYPAIYLLDGSANEDFIHIVGIVQFLTMIEVIPKSIVVGIANVDRRRDFTFPTTIERDKKNYPTTGGSKAFIRFIENELEPFIQQKYKVTRNRTIIGQSLGGLLATEILLKNPHLFDDYMIVSPSLWWNNESLLREAPSLLSKQKDGNTKVYISVGNEEKAMMDDARKLSEILQSSSLTKRNIFFVPLPNEDHLTILHNSVYIGFEMLFPKKTK
jgi:predicted alpha/beta superfamily hydrolase